MVPAPKDPGEEFDAMTTPRWRNPYKALPALRAVVQGAYVAFFLLAGYEFHLFYTQIVAGAAVTARRAPAVEAFLPISALMSLKYFLLTGNFDEVHPAGLVILVAALVSAFLARKVLCSWVCPVGGISRALEWVGEKTLWKRRKQETLLPVWADKALSAVKYLLLGFFLYAVALRMDAAARITRPAGWTSSKFPVSRKYLSDMRAEIGRNASIAGARRAVTAAPATICV